MSDPSLLSYGLVYMCSTSPSSITWPGQEAIAKETRVCAWSVCVFMACVCLVCVCGPIGLHNVGVNGLFDGGVCVCVD